LVFGPIATSARRLVTLLDQLDEVHKTVVVVGHSMGGLAGEHADALGVPMDALVTIGTPP
jgi:pimeloyl-ACP methyl ester carboxylesterase